MIKDRLVATAPVADPGALANSVAAKAGLSLPETMCAAQLIKPRHVATVDTALPTPAANELLIKVEGCGVCRSDLALWKGCDGDTYPLAPGYPGHEAWGRVVALDAENRQGLALGDRVTMISYNGYAEYDVAAADAVVKLPSGFVGQPFPVEPLASAFNVFTRSTIRAGERVAILGVGVLGAILTALAVDAGAEVIAISRRGFALDIARDFGAAHTIPMHDHSQVIEEVKEITAAGGCDCVIEAVGHPWPLDLAAELTGNGGRLIIAGHHQEEPENKNRRLWKQRGIDVIPAYKYDPANLLVGMREAVAAVASGRLDPTPLYTHFYELDQLAEAFTITEQRPDGFLKAIITISA